MSGPEWASSWGAGCHLHGRQEPASWFLSNRHVLWDVPGAPWTSSLKMTELAQHASASPGLSIIMDLHSRPPSFMAQRRATPTTSPQTCPLQGGASLFLLAET